MKPRKGLPLPPDLLLELAEYLESPELVSLAQATEAFARLAFASKAPALNENGRSILSRVVSCGHVSILREYLDAGADPRATDVEGNTLLHWPCCYSHEAVAALLVDAGAGMNAPNKKGMTPLDFAIVTGHDRVVEALLAKGAVISDCRISGLQRTTLHVAAIKGYPRIVKLLVDHSAPVHAVDESRYTPLHSAAPEGDVEIVKTLLGAGTDGSTLDKWERSHQRRTRTAQRRDKSFSPEPRPSYTAALGIALGPNRGRPASPHI